MSKLYIFVEKSDSPDDASVTGVRTKEEMIQASQDHGNICQDHRLPEDHKEGDYAAHDFRFGWKSRNNALRNDLASRHFYELMQTYRYCPIEETVKVAELYEQIKDFLRGES